jgi:signal transduction histidine kinase/CheY-like chemotaxis protein
MSRALRVLIVDDTPDIRFLLTTALGALGGFDVVGEAENGAEAVRLAEALHPDAVLLDLAMPVMDGLQATPLIHERSPETRIVILSGFSKEGMETEALQLGACAFLEKGTKPKEIAETLRRVCDRLDEVLNPPSDGAPDGGSRTTMTLAEWRARIANAVEQFVDLAGAFAAFGDLVRDRISYDRSSFSLSDRNGFRVAASHGPEDGRLPVGTLVPVGQATEQLDAGRRLVQNDASRADSDLDRYFQARGLRSYAAVPVRAAGRAQALVGFSAVDADVFADVDWDYVEGAVHEAAAALYMLYEMGRKQQSASATDDSERVRLEWNKIVRHDLRSPLTVINGFASTMQTAWDDLPDGKKLEMVEAIARGATAMSKLLKDMETVDSIEAGINTDAARPMELGPFIEQVVSDVVGHGRRLVVTNVADDLPKALADEGSQRRVLSNLLENAFKFSPEDEAVEVAVEVLDDAICVTVRDRGPGISECDKSKLFQRFSRLEPPDGRKVAGSGLGLYICKSLVEAQGGRIWVESTLGEGAAFRYTVPISAENQAA